MDFGIHVSEFHACVYQLSGYVSCCYEYVDYGLIFLFPFCSEVLTLMNLL